MKKNDVNYPALLTLFGLLALFYTVSSCEKQDETKASSNDKLPIIEQYESEYYIPTYEVQIK